MKRNAALLFTFTVTLALWGFTVWVGLQLASVRSF